MSNYHRSGAILVLVLFLISGCANVQSTTPGNNTSAPAATIAIPTNTPEPNSSSTTASSPTNNKNADGVVNGWAVLAEKDNYDDVEMTNLPIDYINITQLRQVLLDFGWQASHIREAREFDREALVQALDWLEQNADQDDIVFFYVASHGMYLRRVMQWNDFFAGEWEQISSHQRLLLIDSCQAANYTAAITGDPAPYLSIAAVAGDEYGWSGLEEEGLPIIGGVFTHYFAAAFQSTEADSDGNGLISVQEAAILAEVQQRAYMHDVVFAVPEFVEDYHGIGVYPERDPEFPHVIVNDNIGTPMYLELGAP